MAVKEGRISIKSLFFYLLHWRKLRNPKTLARIFLNKEIKNSNVIPASNIIEAIDAIMLDVRVFRKNSALESSPLLILHPGDIVNENISIIHMYWNYDGEKLIYDSNKVN